MSTYWGYACTCHDPVIVSEHWFNHGEETLAEAYRMERAGEWPDREDISEWAEPVGVMHRGYATTAPIHWLREHPHCVVVLHNEHGDARPIHQEPT